MLSRHKNNKRDLGALLRAFNKLYPNPRSELDFKSEYQLIVAVILSAQCTDKKVNQVTPELFARYPSFAELGRAELSAVETIIRPVNYYRTKSKHLVAMAQKVMAEFGGAIPRSYTEIRTLPGVGNKTANVVLGELGVIKTFPVDTHVFRLSHRLGLARAKTPEKVEIELKQKVDSKHWREMHHWLILHGRRVCKAQNPLCAACTVARYCPSRKV